MGSANSSRACTDNRNKTRSTGVRIPTIETIPPHSSGYNPNRVPSKLSSSNSLSPHGQSDKRKSKTSSGENEKETVNGQASSPKPHWSTLVDQSAFNGVSKISSNLSKSESNLAEYDTESSVIDETKTRSGSELSKPIPTSQDTDNEKIVSKANSETGETHVQKETAKRKESSTNSRQQYALETNALGQSKKRLNNDVGKSAAAIVNIKRRMSESEIVAVDLTAHYNNPVNELDPEICHNEDDLEHLIESDNHIKGYSSDDFIAADLTHYSNPLSRALSTGYH